jgi:hypothetical protein
MFRSLPSLPALGMPHSIEERAPSPLPPIGHDISRPSSTSTQSSHVLRHQQQQQQQTQQHQQGGHNGAGVNLPGMSALASVASAQSPQMRWVLSTARFFFVGGSNSPFNRLSSMISASRTVWLIILHSTGLSVALVRDSATRQHHRRQPRWADKETAR